MLKRTVLKATVLKVTMLKTTMLKVTMLFMVSLLSLLLAACGGGGGNSESRNHRVSIVSSSTTRVTSVSSVSTTSTTPAAPNTNNRGATGKPVAPAVASPGASSGSSSGVSSGAVSSASASSANSGGNSGNANPPAHEVNSQPLLASDDPAASASALTGVRYEGDVLRADGIFQGLSSFNNNKTDIVTVNIRGTDVSVSIPATKDSYPLEETGSEIKSLKDTDGSLLGYYGWVTAVSTEPSRDYTSGDDKHSQLALFYAVNQAEARQPINTTATYKGTFLYAVSGLNNTADATFDYKDKKLTGEIKDNNRPLYHWTLDTKGNDVDEKGSFNVRLKSKSTGIRHGEMQGGFFGKDGQLLAAKAYSRDDKTGDEWAGVVVAEQQKP